MSSRQDEAGQAVMSSHVYAPSRQLPTLAWEGARCIDAFDGPAGIAAGKENDLVGNDELLFMAGGNGIFVLHRVQ